MKTKKKPQPTPTPNIALPATSERRQKLFAILKITGVITLVIGLSVVGTLYGHLLLPSAKIRLASGREIQLRDPVLNPNNPPGDAPEGMVWVPGGEFYMGDEELTYDAGEVHLVYVDGFWMDKHEVTNEQFAKFVAATRYVTDAEKRPEPKDFPDVPLKDLKPFSIVFKTPKRGAYNLETHKGWWDLRHGACWKHPEGPDSTIKGRENYPVVHISYPDALAYCQWAKKRLPTEAEWEFAARGGLNRKKYSWGDDLKPEGKWRANIWQGEFPIENTKEDGYVGAAPVGSFPANAYGLHEMSGNVWEWCADWYQARYYEESAHRDPLKAVRNPPGPESGFDPMEPGLPKRVQRGGSFLCADNYCIRYLVGARGKGEVTSAQNHCGFRCVKAAK